MKILYKMSEIIRDPFHDSLSSEQTKNAIKDLISYPRVVRSDTDPPLEGQQYGCFSISIYDKPVVKEGKEIYGLMKFRGNFSSIQLAQMHAAKLIRKTDSANKIRILPVGGWLPICNFLLNSEEIYDVKMEDKKEETDVILRTQETKSRDEEARRIMKELKQREEELKNNNEIDNPESLDYYTMKRVTEMNLQESIEAEEKKLADLISKMNEIRGNIVKLEKSHPTYSEDWLERYNQERKKSGINPFIPSEKQFAKLDEFRKNN